MLLFVSPSKPMDSVPVHSANQLTVTPNLQAESSFPLMVPGGQRDAGKINGPFPCRYNTQYVNSSYWMRTVYNQHAPIQRGRFHSARNQLPKSLNMNIVDSDSDQTQFPRHICFRGCLLILWVSSPGLPQDLLF